MAVPRDKGWAWIVAIAVFWNVTWAYGMMRTMGLVFLEIRGMYGSSATMSSVLFSVSSAASMAAMPLQSYLYGKITERCMSAVGFVLLCLSLVILCFSNNEYVAVIVFGFMQGCGCSLIVFSNIIVLNVYFRQHLGLVTGFCYTGSGLGQLVMPWLLNYLMSVLDVRGAMFVLGACMLHGLIGSALQRPESYYMHERNKNKTTTSTETKQCVTNCSHQTETSPKILSQKKGNHERPVGFSIGSFRHVNNQDVKLTAFKCSDNLSYVCDEGQDTPQTPESGLNGLPSANNEVSELPLSVEKLYKENFESDNGILGKSDTIQQIPDKPNMMRDFRRLFAIRTFPLFVVGKVLNFISYMVPIFFLAPYAASEGSSADEVVLVLTIFGGVDIFTRPLHGFLVSYPRIDSNVYVGCLTGIASCIGALCVTFRSFASVILLSVVAATLLNPVASVYNVNIVEYVGVTLFPRALPFIIFMTTGVFMAVPPVFGLLFDAFGSYTIAMYIWSSLGLVGAVVTITEALTRKPLPN